MKLEDNLNDVKSTSDILGVAPIATDLVTSLCGKFLGSGSARSVFEYNLDPKYVIKVEPLNSNNNHVEFLIWEGVKYLQGELEWVKKWFAPVKWISPNGRLLVMEKTKPHDYEKSRPKKIPKFLSDVKPNNFGWLGENYVCHDYAQFYNMIQYPKGMQKINWEKWEI